MTSKRYRKLLMAEGFSRNSIDDDLNLMKHRKEFPQAQDHSWAYSEWYEYWITQINLRRFYGMIK